MKVRLFSYGGSGLKFLTNFLNRYVDAYDLLHNPHSRPNNKYFSYNKILVIYSDPRDAVISFFRRRDELRPTWINEHLINLNRQVLLPLNIDIKTFLIDHSDVFELEAFFDEWLNFKHSSIAFVRYERIYNGIEDVLDFLGLDRKIALTFRSQFKERMSDYSVQPDEIKTLLLNRYGSLIKKQQKLPDVLRSL